MKVLHYKSNFLNLSETFIRRVIANHQKFEPIGMCVDKRSYTENIQVFEKPQTGLPYLVNTLYFHLNWYLPFYKKVIEEVRPSVIHAHFGFDGYRMMKPATDLRVPLVVSFYGSDVSRLPKEFDWKRRYRNLAQKADAFISATHHMKQQLINLGFPEPKIHVIPFGLELDKFTFGTNGVDTRKLMMVGRMVEKKGFCIAIEAIKILQEKGINVTLDIYGNGKLQTKLKAQAERLCIEDLVQFHGYVSIEKVLEHHSQHHILLAPSLTAEDGDEEGLPNTILEAMAAGTHVITTNHAAIGEVIINKKNGIIVEEGNPESLARAISDAMYSTKNVMKMKKNARKTIEDHFKIEDVVIQIETVYQKVIPNYA